MQTLHYPDEFGERRGCFPRPMRHVNQIKVAVKVRIVAGYTLHNGTFNLPDCFILQNTNSLEQSAVFLSFMPAIGAPDIFRITLVTSSSVIYVSLT